MMDPFKFINYPMWVKYLVFIWLLLTFILGAVVLFVRQPTKEKSSGISDAKLVIESKLLSSEISKFANHRQLNEPSIDKEKWDESTKAMIKYGQENNNYYSSNLKGKVMVLKEEFKKRNLTNKDLEIFAEHPTNYIGFNSVASALNELAIKLEPSIK